MNNKYNCFKIYVLIEAIYFASETKNITFAARASLIRPAPTESPQDRKVARVGGCSGAM